MNDGSSRQNERARFAGLLWRQYGKGLQHFLIRRLRHRQNAQDLAQEVYLRILRFGRDDLVKDPQAYLYRIATHVVYEFRMKAERDRVVFDSELFHEQAEQLSQSAEAHPMEQRLCSEEELAALLEQLHPTCRMVFVLRKRDGLSYPAIAEKLKISVHTVKKYMFRAGAQLRALRWPDEPKG